MCARLRETGRGWVAPTRSQGCCSTIRAGKERYRFFTADYVLRDLFAGILPGFSWLSLPNDLDRRGQPSRRMFHIAAGPPQFHVCDQAK